MKKDYQFLCPNCEREISAPPAAVGQKTRCCLCEAVIVVPTAERDRQFRDEVQRRHEAARLRKEAEEADKYAQREHEKEALRRRREEEKETRRRQDELVAEQRKKREEETAARAREYNAQTALLELAAQDEEAERKLIRSGEVVSSGLHFCATFCWIGALVLVVAAVKIGLERGWAAVLPCVIVAAASALAGILLAVFAGWIVNYSRVIARISAAARHEARQEEKK